MIAIQNVPARRRFLQITAGGAIIGGVTRTLREFGNTAPVSAQSTLAPDAALAQFMGVTSGSLLAE